MRLSLSNKEFILECLKKYFGRESRIWLFGSRLDDMGKGGDIDLYLEPAIQEPGALVEAKLLALKELHLKLGEQKIDLVIRRKKSPELAIYKIALEQGVML